MNLAMRIRSRLRRARRLPLLWRVGARYGLQERSEHFREELHSLTRSDPGVDRVRIGVVAQVDADVAAVRGAIDEDPRVVRLAPDIGDRARTSVPNGNLFVDRGLLEALLLFQARQPRGLRVEEHLQRKHRHGWLWQRNRR